MSHAAPVRSRRLAAAALAITLPLCPPALAADLHVPGDHPTIQAALDVAAPGDRVLVDGGVHAPFLVFVPDLELIATGGALIDANGFVVGIGIGAPGVTVDGFRVRNAGYGIDVSGPGSRVVRNTCSDNVEAGILVATNDCTIERNLLRRNGQGLALDPFTSGNLIQGNTSVWNDGFGYSALSTWGNVWTGNRAAENVSAGFFVSSGAITGLGDEFQGNVAEDNGDVGFLCTGRGNLFQDNLARRNHGAGFEAGSSATDNTFTDNRANWNAGYGFSDASTGSGTSGTGNAYAGNSAASNTDGASDPDGLSS